MRVRWNGEEPIAQEVRALSGALSSEQQRLQLWVLVECHWISAKRSQIGARHPRTGCVDQSKAKKAGLSARNGARCRDILDRTRTGKEISGTRTPAGNFSRFQFKRPAQDCRAGGRHVARLARRMVNHLTELETRYRPWQRVKMRMRENTLSGERHHLHYPARASGQS